VHKTPEITRLIHENFWIVTSFAFSRPVITKIVDQNFKGEWKYLNKSIHEMSEVRADRALLEMATQLRVLDDAQNLSDYFKKTGKEALGTVVQAGGTVTDLHFRDMTNKIIHAAYFEWVFIDPENPKIICRPYDPGRWVSAEIDLLAVMALVGGLMF